MKKGSKKIYQAISLFLCCLMMLGMVPQTAFAQDFDYNTVIGWRLSDASGKTFGTINRWATNDSDLATVSIEVPAKGLDTPEGIASFINDVKSYTFEVQINHVEGRPGEDLSRDWNTIPIADVVQVTTSGDEMRFEITLVTTDTFTWMNTSTPARFYISAIDTGALHNNVENWSFGGVWAGQYGDRVTVGSVTVGTDTSNVDADAAYQAYIGTLQNMTFQIQKDGVWTSVSAGTIEYISFEQTGDDYIGHFTMTFVAEDAYYWDNGNTIIVFNIDVPGYVISDTGSVIDDFEAWVPVKATEEWSGNDPGGAATWHVATKNLEVSEIISDPDAYAEVLSATYNLIGMFLANGWNNSTAIESITYDAQYTQDNNLGSGYYAYRINTVDTLYWRQGGNVPNGMRGTLVRLYFIVHFPQEIDEIEDYIVQPKEPASVVMNLFDYWIDDNDPGYEEGNPWNTSNDGDDANANGGINTGHALKFYHTSKTYSNGYGGDTNNIYDYGVWNHSTQGARPNVQGLVRGYLDAFGYPVLALDRNPTPSYTNYWATAQYTDPVWYNFTQTNWQAYNNETLTADMRTESLDYLFNPSTQSDGKASYANVTGLLQMNQEGYYYYDSKLNFAEFDDTKVYDEKGDVISDGTFTLYNSGAVYSSGESPDGQFFPFNKYYEVFNGVDDNGNLILSGYRSDDHAADSRAEKYNHHLGFTMEVEFQQPTGGQINHGAGAADDMTFKFAGDDDIWVFVDDVLVLDMGGTHSGLYGEINFATGQVQIGLMDQGVNRGVAMGSTPWTDTTLKALFNAAGADVKVAWQTDEDGNQLDTFADGTIHTLKLFYMERGHWDSNFAMYFNLQSVVEQKLYKVDEDGEPLQVDEAYFELYEAEIVDENDYATRTHHVAAEFKKTDESSAPVGMLQKDDDGYLVLMASGGRDFDFATRAANGQKYYLLYEVTAPTGYRKLMSPIVLEYNSTQQTLKVLNQYEVGAYASFTAILEDNQPQLYYASSTYNYETGDFSIDDTGSPISDDHQRNALLFAVPMIYTDIGNGAGGQWYPIYGSNIEGYNVVNIYTANDYWDSDDCQTGNEGGPFPDRTADVAMQAAQRWALRHNLLAAALRQVADTNAPDWYFQCEEVSNSSADDNVSTVRFVAQLNNLPGDADRYIINNDGATGEVGGADLRLVGLLVDAESLADYIDIEAMAEATGKSYTYVDETGAVQTVTNQNLLAYIVTLDDDGKYQLLQDYLWGGYFTDENKTFENAWDDEYAGARDFGELRKNLDRAYAQSMQGTTRERGVNLAYISSFTRNYGSVIYIPNERRELRVLKLDELGQPLRGTRFGLFESFNAAAGYDLVNQTGAPVAVGYTDENGLLIFGIEYERKNEPGVKYSERPGNIDDVAAGYAWINWEDPFGNGSTPNDSIMWVRELAPPAVDGDDDVPYAINNSIIQVYVGDFTIYANASAYQTEMIRDTDGNWSAKLGADGNAVKYLVDDWSGETDMDKVQTSGTYNGDRVSVMASVGKLFQSMEKYADDLLNTTLLDVDATLYRILDSRYFDEPGFYDHRDHWEQTNQSQRLHFWGTDVLQFNSSDYSTAHTAGEINFSYKDYSQSFITTDNGYLYLQPVQTAPDAFAAEHGGEAGTMNSRREVLYEDDVPVDIAGVFSPTNVIVVQDVPSNTKVETYPGAGKQVDEGDIIIYQIVWENDAKTPDGDNIPLPAVITITDTLDVGLDFVEARYGSFSLSQADIDAGVLVLDDSGKYYEVNNAGQVSDDNNIDICIRYYPETRTVQWIVDQAYVGQNSAVILRAQVNEHAREYWDYGEWDPTMNDGAGGFVAAADHDADAASSDIDHEIVNRAHIKIAPKTGDPIEIDTPKVYNPVTVTLSLDKTVSSTSADEMTSLWHFVLTLRAPAEPWGGWGDEDDPEDTHRELYDIRLAASYEAQLQTLDENGVVIEAETVTVMLRANGDGSYTATVEGDSYIDANGDAVNIITLKHNQRLVLPRLPAGTTYTVQEVEADTNDFRTHVIVEDVGDPAAPKDITGEAADADTKAVEDMMADDRAVHYYNEGRGRLALTKTVVSDVKSGYFIFTVRLYGPDGAELTETYPFTVEKDPARLSADIPMPLGLWDETDSGRSMKSGDAFQLRHGDIVTIGDLPPGTRFVIEEADPGKAFHVTWTVWDSDTVTDGREATGEIVGGKTVTVEYINSTEKNYKTEVDPGDGKPVQVGDNVTYEIYWENADAESDTIVIVDQLDAGVDFVSAAYEDVAISAADASRTDGDVTIVYDAANHTVTWTITGLAQDDTGVVQLVVQVNEGAFRKWQYGAEDGDAPDTPETSQQEADDDNEIVNRAKINNHYTATMHNPVEQPQEVPGVLHISKMVVGDTVDDETAFVFIVTLLDADDQPLEGVFDYVIYRSGLDVDADTDGSTGTIASGGTIALKHGQEATITGLPLGTHYKVEETESGGCTVLANDAQGTIQPAPRDAIALFINYKTSQPSEDTGALTITKTGTVAADDETGSFTFTVVLNNNTVTGRLDAIKTRADGSEEELQVQFENGVSETITLQHGESITIQGLPAGTTYAVIENELGEGGYHTRATGMHGVIRVDGSAKSVWDNTPEQPCATAEDGSLTITKMVGGDGAQTDRAFTFVVTFEDGGSYAYTKCNGQTGVIEGSGEITLKPGQRATFDHVPPGTRYTVVEVEANTDGYVTTASNAQGVIPESGGITAIFVNTKCSLDDQSDPETPDKPEETPDPHRSLKSKSNPDTGDAGSAAIWAALLVCSLCAFGTVTLALSKKTALCGPAGRRRR